MGNIAQYGLGFLLLLIALFDWGLLCALRYAIYTDFLFNKLSLIGGIACNVIGIGLVVVGQMGITAPDVVVWSVNALLFILGLYFWIMNFNFRARSKAAKLAKKAEAKGKK